MLSKKVQRQRNKRGFTLIELILVVAIIGILTAVAVPTYGTIQETSKRKAVKAAAQIGYKSYMSQFDSINTQEEMEPVAQQLNAKDSDILVFGILNHGPKRFCVVGYWIGDEDDNRKYQTSVGSCY